MQVTGRVERVLETPTKFGSLFSIVVNDTRYACGKTAGGVSAGDWVKFSAEQNPKGYWGIEKNTLVPVPPPTAQTAPVASAPKQAAPYVDTRQDSIIYQSSRKDALVLVQMLMAANLIDFGKAKGAAKIDIVEMFVDKYTEHFIDEVKSNKTHCLSADEETPPSDEAFPEDKINF